MIKTMPKFLEVRAQWIRYLPFDTIFCFHVLHLSPQGERPVTLIQLPKFSNYFQISPKTSALQPNPRKLSSKKFCFATLVRWCKYETLCSLEDLSCSHNQAWPWVIFIDRRYYSEFFTRQFSAYQPPWWRVNNSLEALKRHCVCYLLVKQYRVKYQDGTKAWLDADNVFFVTHAKQLRKLNRSIRWSKKVKLKHKAVHNSLLTAYIVTGSCSDASRRDYQGDTWSEQEVWLLLWFLGSQHAEPWARYWNMFLMRGPSSSPLGFSKREKYKMGSKPHLTLTSVLHPTDPGESDWRFYQYRKSARLSSQIRSGRTWSGINGQKRKEEEHQNKTGSPCSDNGHDAQSSSSCLPGSYVHTSLPR